MSKDHSPGGFNRIDGYRSDLEIAEERDSTTRVNTSFGSGNHNVYIHNNEHTHEHFWYDPSAMRSGYHGPNFSTHNNHPNGFSVKGNEENQSIKGNIDTNTVMISGGEQDQHSETEESLSNTLIDEADSFADYNSEENGNVIVENEFSNNDSIECDSGIDM